MSYFYNEVSVNCGISFSWDTHTGTVMMSLLGCLCLQNEVVECEEEEDDDDDNTGEKMTDPMSETEDFKDFDPNLIGRRGFISSTKTRGLMLLSKLTWNRHAFVPEHQSDSFTPIDPSVSHPKVAATMTCTL